MKKLMEIAAVDITIYKFVLPLMSELRSQGWKISVAAKETEYLEMMQDMGYPVYAIDIPRNLAPFKLAKAFIALVRLFRQERPDYIHVHTPIASILSRIAAKLTGVSKIIYTLHGLYPSFPFLQIEKIICRYCTDYIFTVNEEDKQYLIQHRFQGRDRIKNINSVGVDTEVFDPERISDQERNTLKEQMRIQDEAVIGFVGRIVKEKGILELLEAFIRIQKQYPCKLLVIGSAGLGERDEETFEIVKKRIREEGLEKKVILAGHREDIAHLLSVMDLFVLPSYREGMPVSTLEAMAMELPVVATDIRGCREEITKDTGILVPVQDVEALQRAILYFLEHPSERKQKGKAGRKRVEELFTVEKAVEKQLEVFEIEKVL